MALYTRGYIETMLREVLKEDPLCFFWHQSTSQISYYLPQDNDDFKRELRSLKSQHVILRPQNNKTFEFEGKTYYQLVIQNQDDEGHPCQPLSTLGFNFMVSGLPYYFKSMTTRDNAYEYLTGTNPHNVGP